ncbi:MAG TPA: cobalt-precorrin-5B (C(1))-methyltransferase [Dehalococcoidia bacterium]|nr:cobalt-precorrin-5B (C(1))-methyltransferase [Dehalococcoidia bacterium]
MAAKKRKGGLLRSGYTTGACAAAAAQAAAIALLKQETVSRVQIDLPDGNQVSFEVSRCVFDRGRALCSVIKDAGDDPDVTHGAEIRATVSWKEEPGISIMGGEGVGMVTRPGLEVPVNTAAINPVPRQMIERSVRQAVHHQMRDKGLEAIISVPGGDKLARRTLNPRLGIAGGISILGTTGVVIPYSINAYKVSISQALDVAAAVGCRQVVLTTGRRSEKFAQRELALAEECFVQVGDFIGYSLEECARRRLANVVIWGMTGKISKLAAGHLYTNVSDSKVDIGFLTRVAAGCGVPDKTLVVQQEAVTANHFRKMLPADYHEDFCHKLCLLAAGKCRQAVRGELEVECILSSYDGTILGRAHARG